ncbi:hypothetical protein AMATHDRAFT_185367 [Amanita thiersii Skay4041]|uniref:F-box domain-containing protein n=1 Tax=Amanita thiersii Skay4041 TaxID=703135 RepID=A0A2A9NVR2_9AGAR|nr:hypothetical protein AMATHDRAFT_185367 [Amanita thiersii Skay4041]
MTDVPSSSAYSLRNVPQATIPSLATLCARKFASHFIELRSNERLWERLSPQLKALPDALVPKVFSMLRLSCPTYLKHEFIVTYMLRGPSVSLTDALPGVNNRTIQDIPRINPALHELHLTDLGSKITDATFASTLRQLKNLRVLNLRGCSKVSTKAISALIISCTALKTVNLNYTTVNPASVAQLIMACPDLEVLKLAGIPNWTDATFANFLHGMLPGHQLVKLRTIKIRQTLLGDGSINALVNLCPNLNNLDASFTLLKRPTSLINQLSVPPLNKLSLTSTSISSHDLGVILPNLQSLRTLSLGALGISHGSQASINNTSAMTMDDNMLTMITSALMHLPYLEDVSLVGNSKLGITAKKDTALADFISRIGRKCKRLNLAGIPSLHSADLAGLLTNTGCQEEPSLEVFNLNNTGVDDEAGIYISSCIHLRSLYVAGTRFTRSGLFPILDVCPSLKNLDLTSCRGINVVDRRRFFEIWQEHLR